MPKLAAISLLVLPSETSDKTLFSAGVTLDVNSLAVILFGLDCFWVPTFIQSLVSLITRQFAERVLLFLFHVEVNIQHLPVPNQLGRSFCRPELRMPNLNAIPPERHTIQPVVTPTVGAGKVW